MFAHGHINMRFPNLSTIVLWFVKFSCQHCYLKFIRSINGTLLLLIDLHICYKNNKIVHNMKQD